VRRVVGCIAILGTPLCLAATNLNTTMAEASIRHAQAEQIAVKEGKSDTTSYCSSSSCRGIDVQLRGFKPKTHYTLEFNTDCGHLSASLAAECNGGVDKGQLDYAHEVIKTTASGKFSGLTRAFGFVGSKVWVTVAGVQSNTVSWQ
jgi:hypothetical protein